MNQILQVIKRRLQIVEQANRPVNTPELVFICWDDVNQSWLAKEQYMKKNSKGKIIPYSGKTKLISLDSPDSYEPPEGFRGVILKEGVME